MISNKSNFKMTIECKNAGIAEIIAKSLEPENKQLDENTSIIMLIEENELIIELESSSSLSTLRNTIDDIISTISTIESVYKSVKD